MLLKTFKTSTVSFGSQPQPLICTNFGYGHAHSPTSDSFCKAQDERSKVAKYIEALRLRIKEQREGGRENRRELRRALRSLRAYEVRCLALSRI